MMFVLQIRNENIAYLAFNEVVLTYLNLFKGILYYNLKRRGGVKT